MRQAVWTRQSAGQIGQSLFAPSHDIGQTLRRPGALGTGFSQQFQTHRHRQFSRSTWGWCAYIRNKINQCRISFMTHSGNQRNLRGRRCACNDFFIEPPKILNRPPATRNDQQIWPRQSPSRCHRIEPGNSARHFGGAIGPLHRNRPNQDFTRETVTQTVQNIANHRAGGRGHNPNHIRQKGQSLFACRIK